MTHTTTNRPRRADARRNREKVLQAAREAFAAEGFDAQMPDIARRACVGVGTVYRHFPTKEALGRALIEDHWSRLAEIAEAELAGMGDDPWPAFERMIHRSAGLFVADMGLAEAFFSAKRNVEHYGPAYDRLVAAGGAILAAARRAGLARPDASTDDIAAVMCGFGAVVSLQHNGAPLDWRRYLRLMLDGMRAR